MLWMFPFVKQGSLSPLFYFIFAFIFFCIGLMSRVFANGRETRVQSQVESYQRLKKKKWYLMPPCFTLSTISIKGKVEQSREWSRALPYTLV